VEIISRTHCRFLQRNLSSQLLSKFIIIIIIISNLYSAYYGKKNIGATFKKVRIKKLLQNLTTGLKIDKLA